MESPMTRCVPLEQLPFFPSLTILQEHDSGINGDADDGNALPSLPPRFQPSPTDARLAPLVPRIRLLTKAVRVLRQKRFQDHIRMIITRLKPLVVDFWRQHNDHNESFRLFTKGFASLIDNVDTE
jgi:hypothetical protein